LGQRTSRRFVFKDVERYEEGLGDFARNGAATQRLF